MFHTELEKIKTHILYLVNSAPLPPSPGNRAAYGTTWKNMVEQSRPKMTIKYGAEKIEFLYWLTKARIRTHTKHLMFIASP